MNVLKKHLVKGNQGIMRAHEFSGSALESRAIFFCRSVVCPKLWVYDHVGFLLSDGRQIQMSGHRGNDVYITRAVTDDKEFLPQELQVMGLGRVVSVPTVNDVGGENCGTFVSNVLKRNGINFSTAEIYDIFRGGMK